MARVLAEPLAQSLGVPVLIENRPGAGGSLGMDALARATPDGCTLAFSAQPTSQPTDDLMPWIAVTSSTPINPVFARMMLSPAFVTGRMSRARSCARFETGNVPRRNLSRNAICCSGLMRRSPVSQKWSMPPPMLRLP